MALVGMACQLLRHDPVEHLLASRPTEDLDADDGVPDDVEDDEPALGVEPHREVPGTVGAFARRGAV